MLISTAASVLPDMSALALPLLIVMLGWVTYQVTTYALPCLIGVLAAGLAFETGAGWVGAIAVFGVTAVVTFELMRGLFASATHPVVQIALATAFVAPAVLMGYFILERFSVGSVPSEGWRQALCVLGAGLAGMMALARLVGSDRQGER